MNIMHRDTIIDPKMYQINEVAETINKVVIVRINNFSGLLMMKCSRNRIGSLIPWEMFELHKSTMTEAAISAT